ncbi:MAG TPA: DUF1203 domain-containing protein [Gemmatimonadaceae bacterium]|jgi:hypothetical protein|nr:DUF1203 domain-containing protein [Gemmatimonadaceae bacterium]
MNGEGTMQSYRVVAVEARIAEAVRTTLRSPGYGHPAHAELATGFGPCRQCLKGFEVGKERRILFTYDAFYGKEELPLPGPVFIHEQDCEQYPEDAGFPVDMLSRRLTLNAYASGRRLVSQSYVSNGAVQQQIQQLLEDRDVAYIHVRDTEAGCYDFRVERTGDETQTTQASTSNGGRSDE